MKNLYLYAAIVLFLLFLLLALLAHQYAYFGVDLVITKALQSIHSIPFLDIMVWISLPGTLAASPLTYLLVFLLLLYVGLIHESIFLFISAVSADLAGLFFKDLINRPRPGHDLVYVYQHFLGQSFPSGHVLSYTVFFGFLFYILMVKLRPTIFKTIFLTVLAVMIPLVGFSRIYLGAHWASDVLGGYLLGSAWLLITIHLFKTHAKR